MQENEAVNPFDHEAFQEMTRHAISSLESNGVKSSTAERIVIGIMIYLEEFIQPETNGEALTALTEITQMIGGSSHLSVIPSEGDRKSGNVHGNIEDAFAEAWSENSTHKIIISYADDDMTLDLTDDLRLEQES